MGIDLKEEIRAKIAAMIGASPQGKSALEWQINNLCKRIDGQNDLLGEYANEKAALKAECYDLRGKLADAEEALGRTNSVVASMQDRLICANNEIVRLKESLDRSESRANWVVSHPWSNLWAWIKRKLFW
uniref:Uncharacterized protein n=1 Tax=Siphoviridae sp. cty3u30 TaxID=2825744 RepID=A0A8S5Q8L0_9CAUD|nr:MAG TPA: hypothetical protein [Siphoviridae sp. cty3u30]